MKRMEWSENLALGIALIDEQHKTWIGHLNDVSTALSSAQGPTQIAKTLSFLIDYTGYHFDSEEQYMTKHGYPGLEQHREKHAELRQTLTDLQTDFDDEGATGPLAKAVDTFLGNWLVQHIQDVDQEFGTFLKERGIELK
ncbi:bacteriohemerythrin [Candidatus Eisenbacteria bacterium]|uniref:Bacteriohemerythrin n=1 Tax=Eiseniibacteriota bacterium TaxID=2212470 RepID=A0ABV6YJ40_UNCEI